MYTQSTMESLAQIDGLYKHHTRGMADEHTGVRGEDRLSIGHAAGRD